MLILSLDSSYSFLNFTLYDTEKKIPTLVYGENRGKKFLEIFPKILEDLKVDIRAVDIFAVNLGPGYSTGLRVGIATFKTYAQVSGKPLYTYSSFEVFTKFATNGGKYITLLKVSRYWVFGIWEKTKKGWKEIKKPSLLNEEAIEDLITQRGLKAIVPYWLEEEFQSLSKKLPLEEVVRIPVRGFSEVGALLTAEKVVRGQEPADIFKVEPIYFRPPV